MTEHYQNDLYDDDDGEGGAPQAAPAPTKMQNVTGLLANPKTKKTVIFTAAAVAVVGAVATMAIVSGNKTHQETSPPAVTGADVGSGPQGLSDAPNPNLARDAQYKSMVAQASAERASEAANSGQSVQPMAVTVETGLHAAPTPAEAAASAAAAAAEHDRQVAAAAVAAQQPQQSVQQPGQAGQNAQQPDPQYQRFAENTTKAIDSVMTYGNRKYAMQSFTLAPSTDTVTGGAVQPAVATTAQGQAGEAKAVAAAATVKAVQPMTLIGAGYLGAIRIDTGINTDISTKFGGTLLTGPYAGAHVFGTVVRKGYLADLEVTGIANDKIGLPMTPVTAMVLDSETGEQGTATDVDRKLLVRYGVKPLAAGFAAVADYLKSAGTTVNVSGTTVATTVPPVTGQHLAEIVGGSAAQQVNTDAGALDTTPTVRVARGAITGIYFLADVQFTPKSAN